MMLFQPRTLKLGEKVYVKDDDYEWLPAIVTEINPEWSDRVKVVITLPDDWLNGTFAEADKQKVTMEKIVDKEERWINLNDYKDRNLPLQNGIDARDMADLRHLHEAAILYQTKQRHLAKKPYTRVGEIIIAMNPCKWIDDLYSKEQQHLYAKNFVWNATESTTEHESQKDDILGTTTATSVYDRMGVEPHIYEVSSLAYQGLLLKQENQTIIVSGESGAGKTETVKIVLEHLASLDASALSLESGTKQDTADALVQKIIKSSPVFEAFGNAKTSRNHNSSRFGKMTRLHFKSLDNGMWGLCGSSCQTYLLETARVVSQADSERNFHIFYQMLAASTEFKNKMLGEEWSGLAASDFRILNSQESEKGLNDEDDWVKTFEALTLFDWKGRWMKALCQTLSIILRLGNVVFTPANDDEGCRASIEDTRLVAELLETTPEELEHAMTHRFLESGQENVEVPLSADVAKDSLDALLKRIYAYVFSCIVASINANARGEQGEGCISLLDIYGFERFDTNRFEQLCINYANEALHRKYVDDNFKRFKIEYESEGIRDICDFSKIDNQMVLQLFEEPRGIIRSINEECLKPNGTSANFVGRIKQSYTNHERFVDDKLGGRLHFGVNHFAAPVTYDAEQFVERNTNRLPTTLVSALSKSSNHIISGAYKSMTKEKEATKGALKITILDKFRSELKALISSICETETRYIRCLKPNEPLVPGNVSHSTVMRQLKYAGLVAAIDLSRETFPSKITFKVAEERFICLIDSQNQEIIKSLDPIDRIQLMMSRLFASVLEVYQNCDFTLPYAVGTTRVYFRAGALEMLESIRDSFFGDKVALIQSKVRTNIQRKKFIRLVLNLPRVHAQARAFLQRRRFVHVKTNVIVIQAFGRGGKSRNEYARIRKATIVVQSACRAYIALEQYHWTLRAASKVCSFGRMVARRREFLKMRIAASFILTSWRLFKMKALEPIIIKVQAAVRGALTRRRLLKAPRNRTPESPKAIVLSSNRSVGSYDSAKVFREYAQKHNILQLQRELEDRDIEIQMLRNEIACISEEAETHRQELEEEFEERLMAYEDEVLHLQGMLQESDREKVRLEEELASTKITNQTGDNSEVIEKLRSTLKKTQENHKEYLHQITSVLDSATEARKRETKRILSKFKKEKERHRKNEAKKDEKILSLLNELHAMKKIMQGSRATTPPPQSVELSPLSSYSSCSAPGDSHFT